MIKQVLVSSFLNLLVLKIPLAMYDNIMIITLLFDEGFTTYK